MTRDELLDFLARSVEAGWLSTAEARDLLGRFEAGTIPAELLPLALAQAFPALTGPAGAAVLASARSAIEAREGVRLVRIVEARRARITVELLDSFDAESFRLARALAGSGGSGGSVTAWHEAMRDLVARDLAQQAQIGLGRGLAPSELRSVERAADEQARYLARFAEEVSARRLRAELLGVDGASTMSERAIYERARQYAGRGGGLFYELSEPRKGPGWVFRVRAVDDGRTCSVCHAADGRLFLASQGFIPRRDCKARGKCRCTREAVYSPGEYVRLVGEAGRVAA